MVTQPYDFPKRGPHVGSQTFGHKRPESADATRPEGQPQSYSWFSFRPIGSFTS